MKLVRLTLFGAFHAAFASGSKLAISQKKAQALLAYLALNSGSHRRDHLAALLWGSRFDVQARHSLRQCVFVLRKVLEPAGPDILVCCGEELYLHGTTTDVADFEQLVAAGTLSALREAIVLYRGELLDGVHIGEERFSTWLATERARLDGLHGAALARLVDAQAGAGDVEAALATARQLVNLDPLDEAAQRRFMRLLAAVGQRGAALRQFHTCAALLRRELGVEPDLETQRVFEEIRNSEWVPQLATSGPAALLGGASLDPAVIDGTVRPVIAILPFHSVSGDTGQEFLADGLTENIIAALANIEEIRVIARRSVLIYKDRPAQLAQLARERGVGHILEGSIQRAGDYLRITVQLTDVNGEDHLWAERYDRTISDWFQVQDDLTRDICAALQIHLLKGDQGQIRARKAFAPNACTMPGSGVAAMNSDIAPGAFSIDRLKPFMSLSCRAEGDILFRKGDIADRLYCVVSGYVQLDEIGKLLGPGKLFGEIALFSPDRRRTLTVRCATPVELLWINERDLEHLCQRNAGLAFHILRLIARRLGNDVARLEGHLHERTSPR